MSDAREVLVMEIDKRTGARTPRECPKYSTCSAALCPLDHEWHRRSFVKADSICHWQREALAPGAEAKFVELDIADIWQRIQYTGDAMRKKHPDLAVRLDEAFAYRNDPEARQAKLASFSRSKKGGTARSAPSAQAGIEVGGIRTSPDPIGRA